MGLNMYLHRLEKNEMIEIGYWRKANHIHNWFIQNIQNGNDNCKMYSLNKKDLINLKNVCLQVLKDYSKAQYLLPPIEGYFFGSTEIDEHYLKYTVYTVNLIKSILSEKNKKIYYSSFW